MLYREAGQFKTSYAADQQLLPIRQDRYAFFALLAVAFVVVPLTVSDYWFTALLIPTLIFSLAAIGLNILIGYAGQLSLGSAAFMAVGAFAAYNFVLRVPWLPQIVSFLLGGVCAAVVGIAFGLPSRAHQGLLSRGRDAGRAVLRRLGAAEIPVVHERQRVGRRSARSASRSSASRSTRRCASTCSC